MKEEEKAEATPKTEAEKRQEMTKRLLKTKD